MAAAAAGSVRLSCAAMATRFELLLSGGDPVRLRAAGEEALEEIMRLDRQLSFYRADSDLSWVNAHAAEAPVAIEPRFFQLLDRCLRVSRTCGGAFDITVAPLMRAWHFVNDTGAPPEPAALAAARRLVGHAHVVLDASTRTIRFDRAGVAIDLGAAGKGFAIDRAIEILRDHGIASALLHGGTSSVHAIGAEPCGKPWIVAWRTSGGETRTIELRDGALSVSAPHGKAFTDGGRTYGHVMDPRSGTPVARAGPALVTGPGSLECDALSTAVLVGGEELLHVIGECYPAYAAALA